MKAIHIFYSMLCIVGFLVSAQGQELAVKRQYLHNPALLNPAYTGIERCLQATVTSSMKWLTTELAPQTVTVMLEKGIYPKKKTYASRMGFGLGLGNSRNGPFSRSFASLQYCYGVALNQSSRITGGISLSLMQVSLNQALLVGAYDPIVFGNEEAAFVPDASAGFLYQGRKFFAGIGGYRLVPYSTGLFNENLSDEKPATFFAETGAVLLRKRVHALRPSAVVLFNSQATEAHLNFQYAYDQRVRVGGSYRLAFVGESGLQHYSFVFLLGLSGELIDLTYAYDTGLRSYYFQYLTSHELSLRIRFCQRTRHCAAF